MVERKMKKVLLKFVNRDIILVLKSIAKGKGKTKREIDGSAAVRKDVGLFNEKKSELKDT